MSDLQVLSTNVISSKVSDYNSAMAYPINKDDEISPALFSGMALPLYHCPTREVDIRGCPLISVNIWI